MYLCLHWVSLVEHLHKPPSPSWTEKLFVSLVLSCFPQSAGRRAGSFMRCQGDRSTWPTLCCDRVRPESAGALCWQFSGDLLQSGPQCTAVSSAVQLWCVSFDVGRPGLHWAWAVVSAISGVVGTQDCESDKAHGLTVYSPWRSVQLCEKEVWPKQPETKRQSALVAKLWVRGLLF